MSVAIASETVVRQGGTIPRFSGLKPRLLIRMGAFTVSDAAGLKSESLVQRVDQYLEVRRQLEASTTVLSDLLHERVGATDDQAQRRALLAIRRNVHAFRTPRPIDIEVARVSLEGTSAYDRVRGAVELLRERDRLREAIVAEYGPARSAAAALLISSIRRPEMAHGLLLSSRDLLSSAERLANGSKASAGRAAQVERGLLRYFTRATFKSTPFASFCRLVAAKPVAHDASHLDLRVPSDAQLTSVVRLNKMWFGTMWDQMKGHPELGQALELELNPTLSARGDGYALLAVHRGQEVVQRLQQSDALDVVLQALNGVGRASMGELVRALLGSQSIDATEDEVRQFLGGLLGIGLLRFVIPIAAQEVDWANQLASHLDRIGSPVALDVSRSLREAAKAAAAYQVSRNGRRPEALDHARTALVDSLGALSTPSAKPTKATTLYEDCGLDRTAELGHPADLENATAVLQRMIKRMTRVAAPRTSMVGMRWYFDIAYPDPNAEVALLEFYHSYARDHLKEYLARQSANAAAPGRVDEREYNLWNPFRLPEVEALNQTARLWGERLARACREARDAEEVNIGIEELMPEHELPPETGGQSRSANLFAQLGGSRGHRSTRLTVPNGQIFLGFGKYFSRFLDAVDPELTEILVAANLRGDVMLAEIGTDSNFNANLHPPIVEQTLLYPTGDVSPAPRTIATDRIVVRRHPQDAHGLALVDVETGRTVVPLDLGFLNQKMRPALFQLLLEFAPLGAVGLNIPPHAALYPRPQGGSEPPPPAIHHRPRIVIEDAVVVARRSWRLPQSLYPTALAGERPEEHFVRVQEWRQAAGIPREAYVRIYPDKSRPPAQDQHAHHYAPPIVDHEDETDSDSESGPDAEVIPSEGGQAEGASRTRPARANAGSRDYRKPQFIDFASPILVELFARLPVGLEKWDAVIEEVHPAFDDWLRVDGEAVASEAILQFDW